MVLLNSGADRFDGRGGNQEEVFGGLGDDTVFGGASADDLFGDAGLDILRGRGEDDGLDGGADDDMVFAGSGDDTALGGSGNDTIYGGTGDDRISGGSGADVFVFSRNQDVDVVTTLSNGTDKVDLTAFGFANLAAVQAISTNSTLGLRMDLPGEGVVYLGAFTLAMLTTGDVFL